MIFKLKIFLLFIIPANGLIFFYFIHFMILFEPFIMTIFSLPNLPYDVSALEPHFDTKTMQIHHSKHHQTYINILNSEISSKEIYQDKSLIHILQNVCEDDKEREKGNSLVKIRNNAGGHYNHSLFWYCLSPKSDETDICESLRKLINEAFGGMFKLKELFNEKAMEVFGSGWAWLCYDFNKKTLVVTNTPNQDNPIMYSSGLIPILALDVWEHAYYLKYMNLRKDYVSSFWNIVDWKNVSKFFEEYALNEKNIEVLEDGRIKKGNTSE